MAAIAGWVRATLGSDAQGLRAKLDRVVVDALIPERARVRPVREQQDVAAAMRAEWEKTKGERCGVIEVCKWRLTKRTTPMLTLHSPRQEDEFSHRHLHVF